MGYTKILSCYRFIAIKMSIVLTLIHLLSTRCHTYLNKPAAEACMIFLWTLAVKGSGSILNIEFLLPFTPPAFTFSKLTIKTLEKGVK